MRPCIPLILSSLLFPSIGFSQVILMTPQSPSYGPGVFGYPAHPSAPTYGSPPVGYPSMDNPSGYGANVGGYPATSRLGIGAGGQANTSMGGAASTPCIPTGADAPPPSQFRPPISPNYRAFSDRFAPPVQSPGLPTDACN